MPDVIVIGGGLAGGAAAALLAGQGRDVLLLEREHGPHHKVCGEFISIEAQGYLQRLGIDLPALGAVPINGLQLECCARQSTVPLPFTAQSLSRRILDGAVLERAQQAGAAVHYGQAVRSLAWNGGCWIVETPTQTLEAPTVLLACGKHDLRGWPRDDAGTQNDLIGFKQYYRLPRSTQVAGQVQLYLFTGGYAGFEQVEGGHANLCLVVQKDTFAQHGKDWQALLNHILRQTPALATALNNAMPLWPKPLAIYGIPYGYLFDPTGSEPGLYRLGDQLAVIPSLCGDGMAIALHSAFAAAADLRHGDDSRTYHALLERQLRPLIRIAMRLSRLAVRGPLQRLIVMLARLFPGLVQRLVFATRVRHNAGKETSDG